MSSLSNNIKHIEYVERRIYKQIPQLQEAFGNFEIQKEYKHIGIKLTFSNKDLKFTYEAIGKYPFTPPKVIVYYKGKVWELPLKDWSMCVSLSCIYTAILDNITNLEITNIIDDIIKINIKDDTKSTDNTEKINILDSMNST